MRPECEKVEILRGRSLAYREPNQKAAVAAP